MCNNYEKKCTIKRAESHSLARGPRLPTVRENPCDTNCLTFGGHDYDYDVTFIFSDMVMSPLAATTGIHEEAAEATFSYRAELERAARGKKKGERTGALIRIATCRLLDNVTPQELTVSAICKQAKIAHGTFYIYFSDRNALLGDLTLGFVHFVQKVMRAAGRDNPDDTIRAATGAYFELFQQNRGLMKSLVNHLDGFPETREAFHRLNREWIGTVVAAVERRLSREGRASSVGHEELMRRAYALGGMTDQYLAGLLLSQDPTMQVISSDKADVVNTLSLIWKRGMEP